MLPLEGPGAKTGQARILTSAVAPCQRPSLRLQSAGAKERSGRRPVRRRADAARGGGLCRHRRAAAAAGDPRGHCRLLLLCAGRAQPLRDRDADLVLGRDPRRHSGRHAGQPVGQGGLCDHPRRPDRSALPARRRFSPGRPHRLHLAAGAARLRLRARDHHHHPPAAAARRRAGARAGHLPARRRPDHGGAGMEPGQHRGRRRRAGGFAAAPARAVHPRRLSRPRRGRRGLVPVRPAGARRRGRRRHGLRARLAVFAFARLGGLFLSGPVRSASGPDPVRRILGHDPRFGAAPRRRHRRQSRAGRARHRQSRQLFRPGHAGRRRLLGRGGERSARAPPRARPRSSPLWGSPCSSCSPPR